MAVVMREGTAAPLKRGTLPIVPLLLTMISVEELFKQLLKIVL